jgi:O-antigen/teichoic acid export membrane protein
MKREFTYNIVLLVLINIIVKPLYIFGVETRIQNILGPQEYGLYFSLYAIIFMLLVFNDPGIQNYNTIYVAKNEKELPYHFPRLLGAKAVLIVLFMLLSLLCCFALGYGASTLGYIMGICLLFSLSTLFVLLRAQLSSMGYYRWDTFYSSLDKLLLLLVLGGLILSSSIHSLSTFIVVQLVIYALCVVSVLATLAYKKMNIIPILDKDYTIDLIKKCIPYATVMVLTSIIMRLDTLMVNKLMANGDFEAGLYSASYRFVEAASMFGYLFAGLMLPMISKQKDKTSSLFSFVMRLLVIVALAITVSVYFYSNEVYSFFYGEAYHQGRKVLHILSLVILPIALNQIFGALLLAQGALKGYNKILLAIALFALLVYGIAVPYHGLMGAGLGSIAVQLLLLLSTAWYALRKSYINISHCKIPHLIFYSIIVPVLGYGIYTYVPIPWYMGLLLISLIALGVAFAIGLVRIQEFKEI